MENKIEDKKMIEDLEETIKELNEKDLQLFYLILSNMDLFDRLTQEYISQERIDQLLKTAKEKDDKVLLGALLVQQAKLNLSRYKEKDTDI